MIREMRPQEYPLLEFFLYEAIFQKEGVPRISRDIVHSPELQKYIQDFGKIPGDHCLCAEFDGKVVGAVWVRLMDGFANLGKDIPELAVSLDKAYRGKGTGTCLIEQMLSALAQKGYPAVSLSVQKENPAARLYQRLGFWMIKEHGEEWIMACILQPEQHP